MNQEYLQELSMLELRSLANMTVIKFRKNIENR